MPGLIRGVARTAVIAGTATTVSNRVSRRQANKWAAQDAQQAPQPQYVEPAAPAPAAAPLLTRSPSSRNSVNSTRAAC